ncbi:SDR family oxidoreductase [Emcibacter sp. SYSU 3D8]|uniref:SDR family oxidoreductase n=1 Tax=Emcibacter sp. SYSU 3D8 TaxID=3133969 RepID=UPI0031FED398
MTISLEGTVALVTGAGGGIGGATCAALREGGAHVIATDLPTTPQASRPEGVEWLDLDVTDEDNWTAAVAAVRQNHGSLDILVNNAGISVVEPIEGSTLASWRRVMAINVDGVYLGVRSCLPLLRDAGGRRKGGASIVNLSSNAGLIGAEFNVAYCTSKGAVRLMTKALAMEFSALNYKIRVNSVHPGGIETNMLGSIFQRFYELGFAPSAQAAYDASVAAHPIGRMGKPEEIAAGIRFLASDESSNMHGAELVMDGGYTAR